MERMSNYLARNAQHLRRTTGPQRNRRTPPLPPGAGEIAQEHSTHPPRPFLGVPQGAPASDALSPAPPPKSPAADALTDDHILELPPRRIGQGQTAQPRTPAAAARPLQRMPTPPDAMLSLREATHAYMTRLPRKSDGPHPDGAAAAHGGPAGRAPDACPICGGAGFVRVDVPVGDPMFGQAVACECKEREREEKRLSELRQYSSLAPFVDRTFETFEPFLNSVPSVAEAYEIARQYAADPVGWLIFMGSHGVGKTHLAAAIANYQVAAGRPVFFSIVPDLLQHLRSAFAPNSETTYDAMFDKVREAGLLVLDDLGAENSTAWAQEKLFQLINYRYNFRMPTVITTNHRQITNLDERIRSRISDVSLVRQVHIEARDYRSLPRNASRGGAGGNAGSMGSMGGITAPPPRNTPAGPSGAPRGRQYRW